MAEVHVEAKVRFTDEGHRFLQELGGGIRLALKEIALEGEIAAREFAPAGHEDDPRGPSIDQGMYSDSDDERAVWGSKARHAYYQEEGSKRHPQTGWVRFFWEREGREWKPGPNIIDHPGNPPRPFLRPSLDLMYERYGAILRKNISRRVRP